MKNFFNSQEYKQVLSKLTATTTTTGIGESIAFRITYKKKTFTFFLPAACIYDGTNTKSFDVNPLFFTPYTLYKHYKIYNCSTNNSSLGKIQAFESKLHTSSPYFSHKWKAEVFSHSEKYYPDSIPSSGSQNGSKKYKCEFHCSGQWGSWRGSKQTVTTKASSISHAEDNVRSSYKSMCASYPFFKGGGGSASVSGTNCSSY